MLNQKVSWIGIKVVHLMVLMLSVSLRLFFSWSLICFPGHIKPTIRAAVDHMKSNGVEKISLLGFSWYCLFIYVLCSFIDWFVSRGAWVAANVLASDLSKDFVCAALASPNLMLEEKMYGGSLPELMSKINSPLLMMPSAVSLPYLSQCQFTDIFYRKMLMLIKLILNY
jgi:hypothetical protein